MGKVIYDFQPGFSEKRTRNLKILALKVAGETYFDLAKRFRVTPSRIYAIVTHYKQKLKDNPNLLNENEKR